MSTDPLDQLRLPPARLEAGRAFTDELRDRLVGELGPLLPTPPHEGRHAMSQELQEAPAPTITAWLPCDDAHGLIRWLADVLEFQMVAVHEEPGGGIAHAQLSWRTGSVYLGSRHPNAWGATGPVTMALGADDPAEVDRLYRKAQSANVEFVEDLHDAPYTRSHQFSLRDPEGNLWTVGTYRPPVGRE